MAIKMQIRRGTEAAWLAAGNPTLIAGELGFVTDTGKTAFKIGDGTLAWDLLPYVNSTYPEFTPSADLDVALTQGRYPLSNLVSYTNDPTEFVGSTTDGDSILMVTVPTSGIVIQELTTSLTSKRWIRAKNASTWSTWQRLHGVIATDSLTVVNLTATGIISVPDGSAPAPSITNTGDTNTGLYFPADNTVGITTDGVERAQFGTTSTITGNTTITGTANVTSTFTALGISASTSGLASTGGLTVSGGTGSSLAVPLVLGTAAGVGTSVFSTKNTSGTIVTTIRGDGDPTAGTDLTTKSYVDAQIVSSTNSLIVNTNAWVVTTTIPSGPTDYTINISSQTLGVEYVYYWSQGAYASTGGARVANLKVTTNAGIYAQYKSGYRHSAGTVGANDATFGYSETPIYGGYVFQPSLTYTVANITIGQTVSGAVPNVCWGYITIKRIA